MTIKKIQNFSVNKFNYEKVVNDLPEINYSQTWTRNPSWLTLPTVSETEQKFVGLHAVDKFNSLVRIGVRLDLVGDEVNIDWGDGNTETFAVTSTGDFWFDHEYDYDNSELDNTNAPVTFQGTADTVTRSNHGYTNGMKVFFNEINTTTGITENEKYYVVNATTNTFQLSLEENGSAINLVNDGTGVLLPYKQAIVTVTSNGRITYLNFREKHPSLSYLSSNRPVSNWLDFHISMPFLTIFYFGHSSAAYIKHARLEHANLVNLGVVGDFNRVFSYCHNLESIEGSFPSTAVNFYYTFEYCYKLKFFDNFNFNTTSITTATNMFHHCYSLEKAPYFDTSKIQIFNQMFANCHSLKEVPKYDLSNGYTLYQMFVNCYSLEKIPDFNFSSARTINGIFYSCMSLEKIPFMNTKECSDFSSAFYRCLNLKEAEGFDTDKAMYIAGMFQDCFSLKKLPNMNFKYVTQAHSFLYRCNSLHKLPKLNFENLVYAYSMFYECRSLYDVSGLSISGDSLYRTDNMFYFCSNLKSVPYFSLKNCIYTYSMFSQCTELQETHDYDLSKCVNASSMYNGCYSLEKAPNLKNTNNIIYFNSMFTNCYILKFVPRYDYSSALTLNSMFYTCRSLQYGPKIIAPKCTDFNRLFRDCLNLKRVPKIEFSSTGVNLNEMFYSCTSLEEVPEVDCTNATTISNMAYNCRSSYKFNPTNVGETFSVIENKMSSSALNEMYTNLPSVSGKTVSVSGNWGTANDDPTIATSKGWTVSG